jgi:CDP-diacylglycerol--serine O-phosphatidyltransferase
MAKFSKRVKRGIFILPTLFTTGNLVMGCLSIIMILDGGEGAALACAAAIFAGAIFDLFDGMIARLTGSTSDFGAEFDSLSDLVTFGVAPAMLAYVYCLSSLGAVGVIAACWYATCTAWRLARFNSAAENHFGGFSGLPSPAAALTVASFIVLMETATRYPLSLFPPMPDMQAVLAPGVAFMVAMLGGLMVSRVPYLSGKGVNTAKPRPMRTVLAVVVFLFVAFSIPQLLFGVALIYILLGLVLRFLTSVRWAEVVAPALVAWAENMSAPRRGANGKERNEGR